MKKVEMTKVIAGQQDSHFGLSRRNVLQDNEIAFRIWVCAVDRAVISSRLGE